MAIRPPRLIGAQPRQSPPPAPGDRVVFDTAAGGADALQALQDYATPGGHSWVTQAIVLVAGAQPVMILGYSQSRIALAVYNVSGDTVYLGEQSIVGAPALAGGGGSPGFPVVLNTQYGAPFHEAPAALWAVSAAGSTIVVAELARAL